MAKEIERKFLVVNDSYRGLADHCIEIKQAYLNTDPMSTIRIRLAGDRAFITIKNKNHGASRDEWEYPIPHDEACQIMERCHCSGVIEKTRYKVGRWEIDEFHGNLDGLTVAEIELEDENETFDLPTFVGREVTGDPRYYNSSLASGRSDSLTTFST